MGKRKTIIVVGGSHGGPSAVARARQVNESARIILVEQSPYVSWAQVSLRSQLLDKNDFLQSLKEQNEYYQRRYNVEILTSTRARSLDLDARCLSIESAGEIKRLPFDSLVYAGGAHSNKLGIENLSGPRLCHFRDIDDVMRIKQALKEGAKNAVVVGLGFYGIEAALALKACGFNVSIIEQKKRVMPSFSLSFAESMLGKLKEQHIDVLLDTSIVSAKITNEGNYILSLTKGPELKSDLVVVCTGINARTALLTEAGAAIDAAGLIRVDDNLCTSLPEVYACGSAVSVPMAVSNQRCWMPHPAIILRTAHIAGHNAALFHDQEKETLKPFCGSLITQIGDTFFARTGLSEQEARGLLGAGNIIATTVFGSAADTFIYQQEMCVRLLVDKNTQRIVGGEVFGKNGVERPIDLLSVAISEAWAPDKLVDLDMAYVADSGPSFDPLKDAAMRAKMAIADSEFTLSAEQLALWLANNRDFRLVDVGETHSLKTKTPTKSLHLPLESLRERIGELRDSESPIVLFSKSGHRSYLAHLALKQRGINVYHLDGGMATWNLVAGVQ